MTVGTKFVYANFYTVHKYNCVKFRTYIKLCKISIIIELFIPHSANFYQGSRFAHRCAEFHVIGPHHTIELRTLKIEQGIGEKLNLLRGLVAGDVPYNYFDGTENSIQIKRDNTPLQLNVNASRYKTYFIALHLQKLVW